MVFRIDYYTGDQKLGDATGIPSFYDAVRAAREGLLEHNARFAKIVDLSQSAKVEIVHRDVLT